MSTRPRVQTPETTKKKMKTTQNVAFWLSDLTFVFGAKIQNIFGVFPTDFLMILVRVKVKMELATLPKNVIKKEALVQVLVLKDTECVVLVSIWLDTSLWNCKELYLTVTIRCGETKNENCTYFESSGTESGACRVKICKCDPNVCQVCILSKPEVFYLYFLLTNTNVDYSCD